MDQVPLRPECLSLGLGFGHVDPVYMLVVGNIIDCLEQSVWPLEWIDASSGQVRTASPGKLIVLNAQPL